MTFCYFYNWYTVYVIELGIDVKEAVDLLQLVRSTNKEPEADVTALDLLHSAQDQQPIVTFSEQLDILLGGGVPLGKMTEFCGAPGVGKTQMWYKSHCVHVLNLQSVASNYLVPFGSSCAVSFNSCMLASSVLLFHNSFTVQPTTEYICPHR